MLLELAATGLRVSDGELQRLSDDGTLLMKFPLREIQEIVFRARIDLLSLFSLKNIGAGLVLGAISYLVSKSEILSCIIGVASSFIVVPISEDILILVNNKVERISCKDSSDDAKKFVRTVRQMLEEEKAQKAS
jgi:hypothetical protein